MSNKRNYSYINQDKLTSYDEDIVEEPIQQYMPIESKENKLKNKLSLICNNIKNKVSSIFDYIIDLKLKEIYIIYFLLLIWFINLAICTDKDLSDLLFSNLKNILIIFILVFDSLFTIFQSLSIILKKPYIFILSSIMFLIFFAAMLMNAIISLFYNKGLGWQFHLLIIVYNLNSIFWFDKFFEKFIKEE